MGFLLVRGPPRPVHSIHPPPPPPGALRSQRLSPTQPVGLPASGVLAASRALPPAAPSASPSRPGPSSPTTTGESSWLPSPGLGSSIRARIRFSHTERRTIHMVHCLLCAAPTGLWAGGSFLPSIWRSPRTGSASVRWRERTAQSCWAGDAARLIRESSPRLALSGSEKWGSGPVNAWGRSHRAGRGPVWGRGPRCAGRPLPFALGSELDWTVPPSRRGRTSRNSPEEGA